MEAFFIIFKGLSVTKHWPRPESAPSTPTPILKILGKTSVSHIIHSSIQLNPME